MNKLQVWKKQEEAGLMFIALNQDEQYILETLEEFYNQDEYFKRRFFLALLVQYRDGKKATVLKTLKMLRG